MIQVNERAEAIEIVLTPNRSSDWRTNKIIIAVLGSVCVGIALGFYAVMGIWMILPFAGLEVVALAAGLYYASWKLNYQHVVTFERNNLRIEKGVYRPRGIWNWPKQETVLHVTPSKQEWSPPKLSFRYAGDEVEIGEFLAKSEAVELSAILSGQLQMRREAAH